MTHHSAENSYGNLPERYHQSEEDKLIECNKITNFVDELIATPINIGSSIESRVSSTDTEVRIDRSFRYIEGDEVNGWAWPLTEKVLDIAYCRNTTIPFSETYRIHAGTVIHQDGSTDTPIPTIYEICYDGKDRRRVSATIEAPNLTTLGEPDFIVSETTPYDHAMIFNELASFSNLLKAQEREDAHIHNIASS